MNHENIDLNSKRFFFILSRFMWIGLLRGSSDETFTWINDHSPLMYSNWALGEPNNAYGRGENCGHMYIYSRDKAKQWNDELCVNPTIGSMVFMCEIEPVDTIRMMEMPKTVEISNSVDEDSSGEDSGSGEYSSGSGSEHQFRLMIDWSDWIDPLQLAVTWPCLMLKLWDTIYNLKYQKLTQHEKITTARKTKFLGDWHFRSIFIGVGMLAKI